MAASACNATKRSPGHQPLTCFFGYRGGILTMAHGIASTVQTSANTTRHQPLASARRQPGSLAGRAHWHQQCAA